MGFSTTSRPLYSDRVRSAKVCRHRQCVLGEVGPIVVEADIAVVDGRDTVLRVELYASGICDSSSAL